MADDLPPLGKPALNALHAAGIRSLAKVATHTEAELLALHGVGPSTIPRLRAALQANGLRFKK
jgi:predicted Fe-Mo cluster-binding NifX family protein